jgi:hypothetical protein
MPRATQVFSVQRAVGRTIKAVYAQAPYVVLTLDDGTLFTVTGAHHEHFGANVIDHPDPEEYFRRIKR